MRLLNSNIKITYLINKYFLGTITKNEQEVLNKWLANPENKKHFHQIRNIILQGTHKAEWDNLDLEKGWKINQKLIAKIDKKNNRFNIMQFAAAIIALCIIAGGFYFYLDRDKHVEQNKNIIVDTQILPGQNKAELILANGSVVKLAEEEQKIYESGIEIKNSNGIIDYSASKDLIPESSINILRVPAGGEYQLKLPDGTRVWLNSMSELKYPIAFSTTSRKVYLKGEAYFEVEHNAEKPFIVSTEKGMDVTVLGTSFNIMTYDDETNMETTLVQGSVKIDLSNGESFNINPGEQVQFDKNSLKSNVRLVNTELYTSWTKGRFVFEQEELEEILRKLSRWYNTEIIYQNESVKNKRLSANLRRYDDISSFLDLFSQVSMVDFEINGKTILVKKRNSQ